MEEEPKVEETHTITQEDLDANPGLEQEVKVGEEVVLPAEETPSSEPVQEPVQETTPESTPEETPAA